MNESNIKNYFNEHSNYWEEFYGQSNSIVDAILIERKNIIKKFIIDNYNNDAKILDLGGGTGVMSSELIQSGFNVDMLDISKNMIEQAKINYNKLGLDLTKNMLICEDFLSNDFQNKYDLIIALGYFEYQSNYNVNFRKIYSSLNMNGGLIFNIPIKRNLGNFFGLSKFVNNLKNKFKTIPHPGLQLKKKKELLNIIESTGFKIDFIRDHGYGDVYILNKIIPYAIQKKFPKIFKTLDYKNKFEFLKSNKIFFTHK